MSYPLQFLVVLTMALLGCAKVTLQGRASRQFFKNGADSVLFHAMLFLFVALTLVVIFPTAALTWSGFWLSVLCALFTFCYQVFYAQALKEGPVSLTVLICSFSTFLVVIYSTIAFGETLYLSHIWGMILLIISMVLNAKQEEKEKHTFQFSWKILAYALAIGVFLGVFQKFYALGMQKLDAAFMMPTWYGLQTLGMTTIGILAFGDKLCARQKWSIVCGLACIILMNLRVYPLF